MRLDGLRQVVNRPSLTYHLNAALGVGEQMSAPIKSDDTTIERVSKLLPADVTAAFLSGKEALAAYYNDPAERAGPIFWMFLVILILSPFYFRFYSKITSVPHIIFLSLSFVVFALSLANSDFRNVFPGLAEPIKVTSIVLPILWAFLISNIFVGVLGDRVASN
jgi:hypothetical protein